MEKIYEVGGYRPLFIRLVVPLFSILMGGGMIAAGWLFLDPASYEGIDPISGPYWLGFLFGLAFLLGGIAIAIGGWLYGPAYVTRIEVDREQQLARFSILGWIRGWSFTVPVDDIVSGRHHEGHLNTGRHRVNAPWTTVRIRGRRLPMIVDDGALVYEWNAVYRLLEHQTLEPERVPKPNPPREKRSKKKKRG
jgi:hypothetical protein